VATQTDRRVEYMTLTGILRAPRNPKQHDGAGIRASVTSFGLADLPVLDERTGRLVSGHGRLEQLEAMAAAPDAQPPDGVQVAPDGTWLVPVVRGWASATDAEAEAYLLYANKSTMSAGWDDGQLAEMLSELVAHDEGLAALAGFPAGELDELFRSTDHFGNQATAFLSDLAAQPVTPQPWAPPNPVEAAAAAEPAEATSVAQPSPDEPAITYVTMSWTVREEQRDTVRNAVRLAQQARGLGTSADALVAIAEHYMAGTRNPG